MADNIYHAMQIIGETKDIEQFFEKHFVNGNLSLPSFIPMPEDLYHTSAPSDIPNHEYIALYGADNWYDWAIKNWNTKWDTYNAKAEIKQDGFIEARFSTAWDMPTPVFEKLAELYPNLLITIQVVESGRSFGGTVDIVGGNLIVDVSERQWKEYAELLMGYDPAVEAAETVERIETALTALKRGEVTDQGVVTVMASFIKCNMEDFVKFSK